MPRLKVLGVFLLAVGCTTGAGGNDGSGGASSGGHPGDATGGSSGAGGDMTPASGGHTASTGGTSSTGGQSATGGRAGSGGTSGAGGKPSTGGKAGGGATGQGGSTGGGPGGSTGQGGGGAHTNPLSQALIDAFVTAHNQARAGTLNPPPSPALPPVSWDAVLADSAFNYLSKCQSADKTLVDHNANREADYRALGGKDYVGENIYATTAKTAVPGDAVTSWMSEAADYDYATNSGNAGHYTQVVWRTSVRIGCAIVNCPQVKFNNTILCDYAPGGNYNGQKPY
jgi:pathogenesis-related protein 1